MFDVNEGSGVATAWVDESVRRANDGHVYVIAAVCSPYERSTECLTDLLLPGQRFLHWRDERDERRRQIVDGMNAARLDVTIAAVRGVAERAQERARSICLVAVVSELGRTKPAIERLCIEGRDSQLNNRDRSTINNAMRAGRLSTTPPITFVAKPTSPWLWAADAAASLASAHYANAGGSDHWWRMLRPARLTVLHVEP